jgi:hypothetical protein
VTKCVVCGKRIWWLWQKKINRMTVKDFDGNEYEDLEGPMHEGCMVAEALSRAIKLAEEKKNESQD